MRSSGATRAGFTIVEMMVVCAVAFVILGLLADVFIVALQRTNDGRLRVDMQQRGIFAITRWERDIDRTAASGMVMEPGDPKRVAMCRAKSIASTGTPLWEDKIVLWAYRPAQHILTRAVYFRTSDALWFEAPLTLADLQSLSEETSLEEKTMCGDVEEFSLTNSRGDTAPLDLQPLVFKLKLRRPLSRANNFAEFTIERRYTLRNTY